MRSVYLVVAMLSAVAIAQQQPAEQTQASQSQNTYAAPTSAPQQSQGLPAAPTPGHPLDPADVAVLTGKSASGGSAPAYASPQVYFDPTPFAGTYSGDAVGFGGRSFGTFGGSRRSGFVFGAGSFSPFFFPLRRNAFFIRSGPFFFGSGGGFVFFSHKGGGRGR